MEQLAYTEFPVPEGLRDVVRCIWTLEGPGIGQESTGPVLPDGCPELILNHATPFEEQEEGGWRLQPAAFLYGQITRAIHLRPAGTCGMLGVRFQPHGAHRLFRVDMAAYADRKVAIGDLVPAPDRFTPLMGPHLPAMQRIGRAVALLEALLQEGLPADRAVIDLAGSIMNDEGGSMRALKSEVPLSTRQLERRFQTVVGLRPKVFARIIRLRRLIDHMQHGPQATLAGSAHAAGYYDQAHFNREFKAFTGRSPKDYFGREQVLPDHFTGLP